MAALLFTTRIAGDLVVNITSSKAKKSHHFLQPNLKVSKNNNSNNTQQNQHFVDFFSETLVQKQTTSLQFSVVCLYKRASDKNSTSYNYYSASNKPLHAASGLPSVKGKAYRRGQFFSCGMCFCGYINEKQL